MGNGDEKREGITAVDSYVWDSDDSDDSDAVYLLCFGSCCIKTNHPY